jgi:pyruvate,orthophosphate dikinase
MFFGEDRAELVRDMFIAAERRRRARLHASEDPGEGSEELQSTERQFSESLERLRELQQADFEALLEEMRGLPVTIRLLDPPLHEFLSLEQFEERVREAESSGDAARVELARTEAEIVGDLQEANPMLGMRGIRLAINFPEVYEMQVRAVIGAAAVSGRGGDPPILEIMLPLIAYEAELEALEDRVRAVAKETMREAGVEIEFSVGTMIELPRACLIAERIAAHAGFFSFGTNDLTQTTLGFSRDDVEASFMPAYLESRIIDRSPFETLDIEGVGELVKIGVSGGRRVDPALKCGVCGEHGGDPDSIRFFDSNGIDYVSCSPYRVPIARIAAAQAAIDREG